MTIKRFSFFVLLALIAAAVFWQSRQPQEAPPAVVQQAPALWLPTLPAQLEHVTALDIRRPGQPPVRLERRSDAWVVPAKADYPAMASKVVELLQGLASARKIEPLASIKAAGLQERDGSATGVDLSFSDGPALKLLISESVAQNGVPVRRADEQQGWLIAPQLNMPLTELQWLDRRIILITPDQIATLMLRYPRGQALVLDRRDGQPGLQVPARRGVSAQLAQSTASVFADLHFADAAPLSQVEFKGAPELSFTLTTVTGGNLEGHFYPQGGQHWLVLKNRRALTAEQSPAPSGWAFRIEPEQYQALSKNLTVMLGGA